MRRFMFALLVALGATLAAAGVSSGSGITPGAGSAGVTWPLSAPTGLGAVPTINGPTDNPFALSSAYSGGALFKIQASGNDIWGWRQKSSITNNTAVKIAAVTLGAGTNVGMTGQLLYIVGASGTVPTGSQSEVGIINFSFTGSGGTITPGTTATINKVQALGTGTLTVTWSLAFTTAQQGDINVNINSSLGGIQVDSLTYMIFFPGTVIYP